MGLIIFGALVLVGAIAVVIFSLRRNSQGEDDDPLQARLAEFIQRGDVTSLEEIELSQPFSERVIIPVVRRIGGTVLSLIPVFLTMALWFISPEYIGSFFTESSVLPQPLCGIIAVISIIGMIVSGYFVMMKIADIEV